MKNPISLLTNQVHLWLIDEREVLLANILPHLKAQLSAQELQQAGEMKSASRQQTFIISRAALRSIIPKYTGEQQSQPLSFALGEHGKPSIDNNSAGLQFNLSHSGHYIVIAMARYQDVGVDIEAAKPGRDIDKIAESYFHPAEWQTNAGGSDEQRFYALWTLKEAFIKAEGKGLAIPLTDFYFDLADPDTPTLIKTPDLKSLKDWYFRHYTLTGEVSLALAIENTGCGEPLTVTVWRYIDENRFSPLSLPIS